MEAIKTLADLNDIDTFNSIASTADTDFTEMFYGGLIIFFIIFAILMLISVIIQAIALWKIFEKAGKPGWAAIVPIYSQWVLLELVGFPGWLSLLWLVPYVGQVAPLAINVIIAVKLPEKFGKKSTYAIGLILLPFIFYPMLGFGKAEFEISDEEEAIIVEND